MLHDEWSWVVLALRNGTQTLDGLRMTSGRFLPSTRLLTALRELEAAGVLWRQLDLLPAIGVRYALTDLGQELALFILHARRTLDRAKEVAARPRPNPTTPDETSLTVLAYKGSHR